MKQKIKRIERFFFFSFSYSDESCRIRDFTLLFEKRSRRRGENFSISFFVPLFYSMEKERGENEYKRGIRFSLTYPKSYEAGICFFFYKI
jgi:hypothetical protein